MKRIIRGPKILLEPFTVFTLVGDVVIARQVYKNWPPYISRKLPQLIL